MKRCAAVMLVVVLGGVLGSVALAQSRSVRSIAGPVTRDAVTRSLAVVPEGAGNAAAP